MLYESVSVKSQVSGSSGPLPACPQLQLSSMNIRTRDWSNSRNSGNYTADHADLLGWLVFCTGLVGVSLL